MAYIKWKENRMVEIDFFDKIYKNQPITTITAM